MKFNFGIFLFASALLFFIGCEGEVKESTTENGFRYEHHVKNGGATPQVGEYAYFHVYIRNPKSGFLSYDSRTQPQIPRMVIPDPVTVKGQNPQPVLDALPLMSIGDSLTIYMNIDSLGRKPPGFEDANEVAYDILLEEIKSKEAYQVEFDALQVEKTAAQETLKAREAEIATLTAQTAADYLAGKLDGQIKTTDSGLKYLIHEEGTGAQAVAGKGVTAQYYGTLTDGTMFDNSFGRGQAFSFPLGGGRVIRGWDEGFALFKVGTKATLFIPSELGYGAAGSPPKIPGGAELMFYVELEGVQ